ncbi:MAG: PDZ domain-containing protein [Muribaculaceae bacterium]|nr:PDZ domain-containing protein [Muribaculaceae bacterium]
MKRVFLAALIFSLLPAFPWAQQTPSPSHDVSVSRNLATFNSIVKELELNYVDTIRPREAFGAAIEAFLSTVDPYTEYYSSEDRTELTKMTTGQYDYGGIGSFIMQRDGASYISGPMEGAPAAKAGLRSGDKIIRVDSVDTSNMGSADVSSRLRGLAGTPVQVTVHRPFVEDSIITFDIVRAKLTDPSVPYYGVIGGNTGYIRLTQFLADSGKDVYDALQEFKANPEVSQIVLDLRGNGGGLLESAVDILGNFLPKGTEVIRTRGKDKATEKIYKTTKTPIFPDIPLAVLIDGGSASASEITAGAIQDLDRGILVGSRSFGKGLVQSTRPLPFDGLLKVTVAKYYTPSGRLIQALDYSHRNPDGSVARTPDSLTNVYHTALGREVRDGGGLTPDIQIDWGRVSPLLYNLASDNKVFDYATKYANTHDSIPSVWNFEITDEIYEDFKSSLDLSSLKYDKVLDQLLKQLRETAEAEGYLTEEAQTAIDNLSPLLTNDVNQDLDIKREEIAEYLAGEIASRYYFENGRLIQTLKHDKALATAIETLSDTAKLNGILGKTTQKK